MQREIKAELCKGMISGRSGRLLGALGILLCLVSPGWAQLDSTGLTGTVSDADGHRLPGAERRPAAPSTPAKSSMQISSMSFLLEQARVPFAARFHECRFR